MATALIGGGRVRLAKVGTRTYRVPLDEDADVQSFAPDEPATAERFVEDDDACLDDAEDAAIQRDGDGWRARLDVARELFKFIIGKQGATKTKIQTETGATIAVPRPDDPKEEIVIRGPTQAAVASAKARVEIVVAGALSSLPYTHFLSIRLGSGGSPLWSRAQAFREQVLSKYGAARGIHPSVFVPPEQLHLTLLMLRLYGSAARREAAALLQKCAKAAAKELAPPPLSVRISGLDYMTDDRAEVDVLYAKVQPGPPLDRLQRLVGILMSEFKAAGFVDEQQASRPLKLHATLMNSKYRREEGGGDPASSGGPPEGRAPRVSFDATGVLRDLAAFDFGEVRAAGVELSRRGPPDPATGYYPREASLPLP